jgi:molybdopterin synthase sulfur carrier subunit
MPAMKIEYFAVLRDAAHKREEEWTAPAATLGDLLRGLIDRYGHEFEKWLLKDGKLSCMAAVFVDGKDARHLQGLETPLHPDAEVVIFPPVAGG